MRNYLVRVHWKNPMYTTAVGFKLEVRTTVYGPYASIPEAADAFAAMRHMHPAIERAELEEITDGV